MRAFQKCLVLGLALTGTLGAGAQDLALTNVSYDGTKPLFAKVNLAFAESYGKKSGLTVDVAGSHGGEARQVAAVLDGFEADVVTLALGADIDRLSNEKLVTAAWAQKAPQNASPFTSPVVFVVRKGNPKGLHSWTDLAAPGIQVALPNPRISANAKWSLLAAYGAVWKQTGHEDQARATLKALVANAAPFNASLPVTTTTFTKGQVGDVLVTWESDALQTVSGAGGDQLEIVFPTTTILAEPVVSVVDKVVDNRGTRKAAEAYVAYLYTPEAQDLAAQSGYRPRDPAVLKKYQATFPQVTTFTLGEVFGSWKDAETKFFEDGGLVDQLNAPQ